MPIFIHGPHSVRTHFVERGQTKSEKERKIEITENNRIEKIGFFLTFGREVSVSACGRHNRNHHAKRASATAAESAQFEEEVRRASRRIEKKTKRNGFESIFWNVVTFRK